MLMLFMSAILFAFSSDTTYESEIKEWREKRVNSLKDENGWLNLVGLLWLEEGENTFGGNSENDIVFPANKSKAELGKFILKDGKVTLVANKDAEVFQDEKPVETVDIFPYEKPIVLKHSSLRWYIIKRGDKYAVRLRDLESQQLKGFKGIDSYPIQPDWNVKAKFEPTEGKKIAITDITGRTADQDSPGRLVFKIKGKEYRLDAVSSEEKLFLIFSDVTSKHETYGSGRFLYADFPDAEGHTRLDFNKAINPPCAFSPYATCPLPPKQNKLAVAITAGEKNYEEH